MKRWTKVAVATTLAVTALAAGCSAEKKSEGTTKPGGATGAAAPELKKGSTITMWIMPNSPQPVPDLEKVLAKFTQDTGVNVKVEAVGWGDALAKLTAAATSGQGPDVTQLGTTWVAQYAAMGALADVTEKVADVGGEAAFPPPSWNTTKIKGKDNVYSIPWFTDVRAIFYRKDVLAKAGLDPATAFADWDSFRATLEKINGTAVGGKKMAAIGMPGKNSWDVAHNMIPWMWGAGGSELSSDGKESPVNSPEATKGVMFWAGLAKDGLAYKPALQKNTAEVEALFANGNFSVIVSNPGLANTFKVDKAKGGYKGTAADGNFAVAPVPAGPAGRFTFFGGSNLSIFKSSKNQNEAWALVKYLATKDAQLAYSRTVGFLPATVEAQNDPAYAAADQNPAFLEAVKSGRSYPGVPAWGGIEQVFTKHFGNIWETTLKDGSFSEASVKASLDAAAKEAEALLAQTG